MSTSGHHPGTAHRGRVTDFDFLTGAWDVSHRRLRRRGVGSDDWDTFSSTSWCEPRLGGLANVDQVDCPDRGFSGLTLRVFDPVAEQWSIWWVSSTVGRLEPPVTGGFDGTSGGGASGVFEGADTDGGRPVTVRFTWTVIDEDHARWQQAFTLDGLDGTHWETNWIMDFSRRTVDR
jgi:hypothetical protein